MALLHLGALLVGVGAGRSLALVPGQGTALRHQHATGVEGPVAQLGVLGPPLGERLVAATQVVVEGLRDAEVSAGDDAEQVRVGRGEVLRAGHVELDPLRRRDAATVHHVADAVGRPDVVGGHPVEVGVVAEAEREDAVVQVVPAGVGLDLCRFGDHVAVQEHQDRTGGGRRPGVAGPGQAEPGTLLGHHAGLERRPRRNDYGRVGPVVGDDHLEEVHGVGLVGQGGEREGEGLLAVVAGHHHRDALGGLPVADLAGVQRPPVVAVYDVRVHGRSPAMTVRRRIVVLSGRFMLGSVTGIAVTGISDDFGGQLRSPLRSCPGRPAHPRPPNRPGRPGGGRGV